MFAKVDTNALTTALDALTTGTPAEVDTLLLQHEAKVDQLLHAMAGIKRRIEAGLNVAVNEVLHADLRPLLAAQEARVLILKAVFDSRGGWTRAFKVVNSNGHIHRSTGCHTLYASTLIVALPQVSGMDETEIVELAGEAACTVCYPSAPVDVRKRPCLLFTQEEIDAKAAKDAEKASKAVAKAAKAITNPDDTPLFTKTTRTIATEVSAQRAYVELTVDATSGHYVRHAEQYGRDAEVILTALAHKRGMDKDELRYELTRNVIAKANRDDCPQAVTAAKAFRQHHLQKTALR